MSDNENDFFDENFFEEQENAFIGSLAARFSQAQELGMFVSEFEADNEGIEGAEDPDSPGERLLSAAEDGKLVLVKELVVEDKSLFHYSDKDGYTALHRAAYSDHPEIIKYLVEEGALLDKETEDGWTPLHSACHWNSFKAAKELVAAKADVNAKTNGGQTPLHIASNEKAKECMILLLNSPEIDTSLKNNLGETSLDLARRVGNLAYLFEIGNDKDSQL